MEVQPVEIDAVVPREDFTDVVMAQLQLEWFEVHKRKLTRVTTAGQTILLQLERGKEWRSGDGLFHAGQLMATITIKPTLTICFEPIDLVQAADFCYYIGNRHLPLFFGINKDTYRVPYDGRLYEQLFAKFQSQVQLEEETLLSENLVRQLIKNLRNESKS
ncbi:hypothetical protein KO02_18400 [Sphingobacterium sp. ML3W]|uniref:hypothetical protein n=1 Tax=Sphingobacterium sp. ML3W TaxID=1538644 RepID=UPI0004F7A2A4|nr:hypothetical protein [Sphingobacterium sp. ML3W]AIM38442.1 hypothetical protein KO02_18400 [Sphingobacterium sp. ML3W]